MVTIFHVFNRERKKEEKKRACKIYIFILLFEDICVFDKVVTVKRKRNVRRFVQHQQRFYCCCYFSTNFVSLRSSQMTHLLHVCSFSSRHPKIMPYFEKRVPLTLIVTPCHARLRSKLNANLHMCLPLLLAPKRSVNSPFLRIQHDSKLCYIKRKLEVMNAMMLVARKSENAPSAFAIFSVPSCCSKIFHRSVAVDIW